MEDFIIVDMTETNDAEIILGRPFMATTGCHISVRRGRITFKVKACNAIFCHMVEKVVSPNYSLLDPFPLSSKINREDVLHSQDSPDSDWISTGDPDEGYVR